MERTVTSRWKAAPVGDGEPDRVWLPPDARRALVPALEEVLDSIEAMEGGLPAGVRETARDRARRALSRMAAEGLDDLDAELPDDATPDSQ